MLFESTTLLLQSLVHSLESDGETVWEDHLEFGNQCVYELYQMSRPPLDGRQPASPHKPHAAAFERSVRAIPFVKAMNMAVRRKDRQAAIDNGKAAIAEMSGSAAPRPSAPVADSPAAPIALPDPREKGTLVVERRRAPGKKRAAEAKRPAGTKRTGVKRAAGSKRPAAPKRAAAAASAARSR